MSKSKPDTRVLVEQSLESGGRIRLTTLLEALVPIKTLRALVREFGLTPKGGYRIERAPAKILAGVLVDSGHPDVLDRVCTALLRRESPDAAEEAARSEPAADLRPVLKLKEEKLQKARAEIARRREAATRQREKAAELRRREERMTEQLARQRAEVESLRRQLESKDSDPTPADQRRRIHELQRELEVLGQAEEALRRREAEQAAEIRELRERAQQLEELVPKGRRKKRPTAPPPPVPERFRLPYFTRDFYKSLESKERRSVEQAIQAVLLFCTEGPSYPGLEVKQIEGQDTWSLRASLKLRVYFRMRDDGDIDLVQLADREDQHTALRRLK